MKLANTLEEYSAGGRPKANTRRNYGRARRDVCDKESSADFRESVSPPPKRRQRDDNPGPSSVRMLPVLGPDLLDLLMLPRRRHLTIG